MSTHNRIPIMTLSGGVGRQASNKRLPTEAEDLDNVLVTTERSVEKRPGLEHILGSSELYTDQTVIGSDHPAPGSLLFNLMEDGSRYIPTDKDRIFFKWISIDQTNRFLIGINFNLKISDTRRASITADEKKKFITVWKLNTTLKRMELQSFDYSSITIDHYKYITENPDIKSAEEVLQFALFGSALICLNKTVKAGYRENTLKTLQNEYEEETIDLTSSDFRIKAVASTNNVLGSLQLYDTTTSALSTKTVSSFPGVGTSFGIKSGTMLLALYNGTDEVARYRIDKFLEPNTLFDVAADNLTFVSGTRLKPVKDTTLLYTFKVVLREEDPIGKQINYKTAALPDTVGKNLLPITKDTKLNTLTDNPLSDLFGSADTTHLINNEDDDPLPGNVRDITAAITGDKYFSDKFFVTRGSVFYSVELMDYDTKIEPGKKSLSPVVTDNEITSLDDLKVKQKLRPLKSFSATGVTKNSGTGEIEVAGTVTVEEDTDNAPTFDTFKSIIEGSGADATLSIDSSTNRISIVDDSIENLTLTSTHENFSGTIGNQNFIEKLGLTNTNSKALKRINKDTSIKSLVDIDQNQLITCTSVEQAEGFNKFIIYEEQDTTDDVITGDRILYTVDLEAGNNLINRFNSEDNPLSLEDISREIYKQTNGEYCLCYADNFEAVGFEYVVRDDSVSQLDATSTSNINTTVTDTPSDNSVGVLIMTYNNNTVKGRTAPYVQDFLADTNAGSYTKTGDFATKLGLRHCLRDYKLVVDDKNFNIATQTDLGQSIVSFQNIPIPTEENDTVKNNGAHHTLFSLYEGSLNALGEQTSTNATLSQHGKGKVYECRERFFDFVPGFYRAVNEPGEGNPYYEPVRSEDEFSVLDERTWPIILDYDTNTTEWRMVTPSWKPRISGSNTNNPGPSPLIGDTQQTRVRRSINAITVWRNRLWFAIDDTIFCSEFGNFFNLFLTDPSTIIDTDVIDIRSSVDKICSINNMIGFYDFLFINTDNDIQFELSGSENQITPFTAELSPTTFYSTDPFSRPQLLGSQIYFFAPEKIYLYYSNANQSSITQAVETTGHADNYLPVNFGPITTAPAQDMIVIVDADKRNNLYFYINKFSGDKIAQNSLHRYIFDENFRAWALESFDNYLYMVNSRPFKKLAGSSPSHYFVSRTLLEQESNDIPRLDNLIRMQIEAENPTTTAEESNAFYDARQEIDGEPNPLFDTTTFTLPMHDASINTVVPGPGYKSAGISLPITNVTEEGKRTKIRVAGDYSDFLVDDDQGLIVNEVKVEESQEFVQESVFFEEDQGFLFSPTLDGVSSSVFFGTTYNMNIELSPQLMRDKDMNIIDGVLNLRTILTRYLDSGSYNIEIKKRGEEEVRSVATKRDPFYKEGLYDQTKLDQVIPVNNEGEFMAKVFGDSESTRIFITSENHTPCNISHIELKGIFRKTYKSTQN